MSNFLQVKVPHAVRSVLKAWALDFRNAPIDHPAHPGEAFVAELERLSKVSAAVASVPRLFLGLLVSRAVGHTNWDLSTIDDPALRKKQSDIAAEAQIVLDWCSAFLEYEDHSEMIVVHFSPQGEIPTDKECRHD